MYKAKLSVLAYRLRDFLGCHADKDGYVTATQQEIADELECRQTHLSTAFSALYKIGYVKRVQNGVYKISMEFERFTSDKSKGQNRE